MSRNKSNKAPARELVELNVNGDRHELIVAPWASLAEVLRDQLGLIGTRVGCNQGDCGACTVQIDGHTVVSCLYLAVEAAGRAIVTIEGLAPSPEVLHPIQAAFVEKGAVQCGFCTGGMILSARDLLERNPAPSEIEIRRALSGNLCRCTGYNKIVEAIEAAAPGEGGQPS